MRTAFAILTALIMMVGAVSAQEAKLCMTGIPDSNCPATSSPIDNSYISTTTEGGQAIIKMMGRISGTIPPRDGSMLFKTSTGLVSASTETYRDPTTGGLISANVQVLNGLTIPTAAAGVTPTGGDLVKTSTGVVCMRVNGVYKSLTAINVIVSGLLTPAIASPTNCVF